MIKDTDARHPSEEDVLDRAITAIDPMLQASLQREQKQRRRKTIVTGGIVMATLLTAVLIGVLLSGADRTASNSAQEPEAATTSSLLDRAEQAADLTAAAWKLWQSGDPRAASAKFHEALKLDPQSDSAWSGLGWSEMHLGQFDKAEESFLHCLEVTPGHPAALNGAGEIKFMQRNYVEAEQLLIQAAPQAPGAWFRLSRIYLLQGKYDKANQWIEKLSKQPDGDWDMELLERMATSAKAGKLENALREELEPPAPANDSDIEKLSQRGWRLFFSGKNRPAELAFREALKKQADYMPAINGLGFSLLNQGKPAEAKPLFEQLLREQPNHGGAQNGLARSLKALGETDKAIALWKKIDQQVKQVSAATSGLATTLYEQGDYQGALPYLRRLAKATPRNAQIQKMLERCIEETKSENKPSSR